MALSPELLEEGAELLLKDTPDVSTMRGYAQQVQHDFLRGLSLPADESMSIADSEAFTKEVLARVGADQGVRNTVADVNRWIDMNYGELVSELGEGFANTAVFAQAQGVLTSASSAYGQTLQLGSVTSNALADGELSVGEAIQIGASALSTAATVISAAGSSMAFGPIGAMAAVIIAGVTFLGASADRHNAMRDARLAAAMRKVDQEILHYNSEVAAYEQDYNAMYQQYWKRKDTAVASIANMWWAYQQELGYDFDVRYFPGSPTPVRGGMMFDNKRTSAFWLQKRSECDEPSGCLYFPPLIVRGKGATDHVIHPDVFALPPEQRIAAMASDFAPPPGEIGLYGGYEYYWKTIRALDAHVPVRFDSAGRPVGFWVPESHEMRGPQRLRRYEHIISDWLCSITSRVGSSINPTCECPKGLKTYRPKTSTQMVPGKYLPEPGGCPTPPSPFRINASKSRLAGTYQYGDYPDVRNRMLEYMEAVADIFDKAGQAVPVYQVRVHSDVMQTAHAVSGELAAMERLSELKRELGLQDLRASKMSESQKRDVPVLNAIMTGYMEEGKRRTNIINNLMLGAGGAAAAFGAYKFFGGGR